nr:CRASP family complement regulator-acquiring lipoprotein [Borrelia maritima]
MFHKPKLQSPGKILNSIAILELNIEQTINQLESKKDALDKAYTLDLEKIKNSLEQLILYKEIFFKKHETDFIRLSKK